ncbi:hypothetical protein [Daejeonella sp. JGW-45]|uniref:hypothetical protein n=1 Tax=Daejeonella sp. JGW-45 TaxID=3034148 RepID=UPI0023ED2237|nr:hypothetical protein [Daejeonella sp. JGW-45]
MKKIIGYICIAVAVLNFIGFVYLLTSNPEKLSINSSYFIKKITFAVLVGGVGFWLIQPKKEDEKPNTPTIGV